MKGDIELHLSQEGWVQHKHHLDPRYDQVVLHVCLWQPSQETITRTCMGRAVIQTFLEPALTIPLSRISRLLDLDLYPYRKFVGSGRCAQTLFRHLSPASTRILFSSAAQWRFREKRNYLVGHVGLKELYLPAGIAMALGYKHHAELFLQVFLWLQQQPTRSIDESIALVLGTCGFFDEAFKTRWSSSSVFQSYLSHWMALPTEDLPRFPLQVQACRPYNHPVRRLVALAHLAQDETVKDLLGRLKGWWRACWADCTAPKDYRRLATELMTLFPRYEHLYWNSHYLFEESSSTRFLTLMGKDLFFLVLVNTLVPLFQDSLSSPKEEQALLSFVDALTLPISGKRRYLIHRYFGDSPQGEVLRNGLMEQGAFQLHRNFCVHFEASCEGCPFVERMKNNPTFPF